MSLNIALTGINASTTDLNVLSNNIANSNTTGFKSSRAEFGDMVAGNSANSSGMGVRLQAINQKFTQGSINNTGLTLDLAINGDGFFQMSSATGFSYTRAGSFQLKAPAPDNQNIQYIVDNTGKNLMGFLAVNGQISAPGGTEKLFIDTSAMPGTATSNADFNINLDAGETTILDPANFDITDLSTSHYSTALTVYDSLGVSHDLRVYFIRPDITANAWDVIAALDGGKPITAGPPIAYTTYNVGTLAFDTSGIADPATAVFTVNLDPDNSAAAPLTIDLDLSQVTQFGGKYSTNSLSQDGNAMGLFTGISIDNQGIIYNRYSNGKSVPAGQVALANFANPQGLQPIGDTNWVETAASGNVLVGAPQSGTLGTLVSGALEGSNVDLTQELVKMITAQRSFQANTQVITTNNTLYQAILNIR